MEIRLQKRKFLFMVAINIGAVLMGKTYLPLSAAGVTTFSTKEAVQKTMKIKKKDKKAQKTKMTKKIKNVNDSDTFTGICNQITVSTEKKIVKKKFFTKGKKRVKVKTKTTTTTQIREEELSSPDIQSVSDMKKYLPSNLYDHFLSSGFRLQFVDSREINNAAGYFSAQNRVIKIARNYNSLSTVLHEFGHYTAFAAGNADRSSSFNIIYNEEKDMYTGSPYNISSASEYFAESFGEYIENPSALMDLRPKTYHAIVQAVLSLK